MSWLDRVTVRVGVRAQVFVRVRVRGSGSGLGLRFLFGFLLSYFLCTHQFVLNEHRCAALHPPTSPAPCFFSLVSFSASDIFLMQLDFLFSF